MHRILCSELMLSELKEFFSNHPNGVILNAKINDSVVKLYNYSYTELLASLNTRLQTSYADHYLKSFSNRFKHGNYYLDIQTQSEPTNEHLDCNEINKQSNLNSLDDNSLKQKLNSKLSSVEKLKAVIKDLENLKARISNTQEQVSLHHIINKYK